VLKQVVAHDIYENAAAAEELGFRYESLAGVLARSHAVSLHVSLNKATHHLMNAERLAQMKQGAILINTARGRGRHECADRRSSFQSPGWSRTGRP